MISFSLTITKIITKKCRKFFCGLKLKLQKNYLLKKDLKLKQNDYQNEMISFLIR